MQVVTNGNVYFQHNIDNSVTYAQSDLRKGLEQLKQMIASGAVTTTGGSEVITEVAASLDEANGQPTGRLKAAAQRLRDILAKGGATAEDVGKIAAVIGAISAAIGG